MGNLIIYFVSCLCLYLLVEVIKFFNKVWWAPIRIQSAMRSQGIKGPPYRFLHGNTKEITSMRMEKMSRPMDISHEMLPRVHPHIYAWIKLYGMNFLNWYGTRPQLVVTDPELVKEIMNSKEDKYCKIPFQENIRKIIGDGLVFSRGEKWQKMRKLANHAFHAESLKGMVPAMVVSVEMMLARWKGNKGKEIEIFQEFQVLTSEIISRAAFGSSFQEGNKVFDMLTRMISIVARTHFKVEIPGIRKLFKAQEDIESDRLQQEIQKTVMNMIKTREEIAIRGDLKTYGSDFLGLLLKAHNDPDKNKRISIDDLIDECKTFYVAGYETTASSLTWTVLLLAIHTDWQEKARKEVLELFGQQNPTSDDITRLKIVTMIINESLRLYAPVFHMTRQVQKEVKLRTIILPESMEIYIPTFALHHDPQVWGEDAHLFKPERFAEGVANASNNVTSAFVPFGLGTRYCAGFNFALTEEKIALSMILQRYRFTLSPTYIHSPVHMLTLSPKHGVQIILEAL